MKESYVHLYEVEASNLVDDDFLSHMRYIQDTQPGSCCPDPSMCHAHIHPHTHPPTQAQLNLHHDFEEGYNTQI